jgi:hypothetical protein
MLVGKLVRNFNGEKGSAFRPLLASLTYAQTLVCSLRPGSVLLFKPLTNIETKREILLSRIQRKPFSSGLPRAAWRSEIGPSLALRASRTTAQRLQICAQGFFSPGYVRTAKQPRKLKGRGN